jgi:hypothetical protein
MAEITRKELILAIATCRPLADLMHGPRLRGVDLSGLDLSYLDLSGAVLAHANLKGCSLVGANLTSACAHNCNFTNADLTDADVDVGASLCGSLFTRARLCRANLAGVDMDDCDFTNADFTGASLSNGSFMNSKFRLAKLVDVDAEGARFKANDWLMAEIRGGCWTDLELAPGYVLPDDHPGTPAAEAPTARLLPSPSPAAAITMLFEDIGGQPIPRIPRAKDGTVRTSDGVRYFDPPAAAGRFRRDELELRRVWVDFFCDLVGLPGVPDVVETTAFRIAC